MGAACASGVETQAWDGVNAASVCAGPSANAVCVGGDWTSDELSVKASMITKDTVFLASEPDGDATVVDASLSGVDTEPETEMGVEAAMRTAKLASWLRCECPMTFEVMLQKTGLHTLAIAGNRLLFDFGHETRTSLWDAWSEMGRDLRWDSVPSSCSSALGPVRVWTCCCGLVAVPDCCATAAACW